MRQQVKYVSQKVVLRTGHECLSVCLPALQSLSLSLGVYVCALQVAAKMIK